MICRVFYRPYVPKILSVHFTQCATLMQRHTYTTLSTTRYTLPLSMAEALLAQEHHDYLMQIREMELLQLHELQWGPAVGEGSKSRGGGNSGEGGSSGADVGRGVESGSSGGVDGTVGVIGASTDGGSVGVADVPAASDKKVFSFANITQVSCGIHRDTAVLD